MADPNPPRKGPVLVEYGPAAAPRAETARSPVTETGPARQPDPASSPDPVPPPSGDNRDARAPRGGGSAQPSPADAPPIDDGLSDALPRPRTMEMVTRIVGSGPSGVTRFFLNSLAALVTFLLGMAALNFFGNLMARYPLLGWVGIALFAVFTLATLAMAVREYAAFARFGRIDAIHRHAGAALAKGDLAAAREVVDKLDALYASRP